jgi:purine-nucleoside/S-methyl-5'-thioadenosine phosphorylase / adenosine deaminase
VIPQEQVEAVDDFASFGIHAFTTTRLVGTFSSASEEPARDVMGRWDSLRATVAARGVHRLATAAQVHGPHVRVHVPGWEGWLRGPDADGHVATVRGTAMAVSVADCVPVFLAHPSGATALLHSGWRGTAARIVEQGIAALAHRGFPASELRVHLGPAICGKCYQVSADVVRQLTGKAVDGPGNVDLRALIADHARAMGVHHVSISPSCSRHDNARFFSHRAGDRGRQVAVIFAEP